jgi:hypothetical protein
MITRFSLPYFSVFRRFDSLERVIDDKMKMLFDVANNIAVTNNQRQNNNLTQSNELLDSKNCFVIDKLVFPKDK